MKLNTRIYNLISGPHVTHFSAVVGKKWKKLEKLFALKRANIACRQQMTTVTLLQKQGRMQGAATAANAAPQKGSH